MYSFNGQSNTYNGCLDGFSTLGFCQAFDTLPASPTIGVLTANLYPTAPFLPAPDTHANSESLVVQSPPTWFREPHISGMPSSDFAFDTSDDINALAGVLNRNAVADLEDMNPQASNKVQYSRPGRSSSPRAPPSPPASIPRKRAERSYR